MDQFPESDRLLDFPHPREQSAFYGNADAEQRLLQSYARGRIHHAWILGGPSGIGKATLAYRFARFVLKYPPESVAQGNTPHDCHIAEEDPVFRRVAALGHSDLFVARRPYDQKAKRLKRDLDAETIRKTSKFFTTTSGVGGWRVCIVDAADDMNRTAANALLKILEEPPDRCLFLLISHAPMRLLETIRSRCIRLDMHPLGQEDVMQVLRNSLGEDELPHGSGLDDLLSLAQGRPGYALTLLRGEGLTIFSRLSSLFTTAKPLNPRTAGEFADFVGARGADENYATFCSILLDWLAGGVRSTATGSGSPGDHPLFTGRDMAGLAEVWQKIAHSIDRTNALNLDRRQTVLQSLYLLENTKSSRT